MLRVLIYRNGIGVHRLEPQRLPFETAAHMDERLDKVGTCLADALDTIRYPRFRGPRMSVTGPVFLSNENELRAARAQLETSMVSGDYERAGIAASEILEFDSKDLRAWYVRGRLACEHHNRLALRDALAVLPGEERVRLRRSCGDQWTQTLDTDGGEQ